jgi:hypothetical protein
MFKALQSGEVVYTRKRALNALMHVRKYLLRHPVSSLAYIKFRFAHLDLLVLVQSLLAEGAIEIYYS